MANPSVAELPLDGLEAFRLASFGIEYVPEYGPVETEAPRHRASDRQAYDRLYKDIGRAVWQQYRSAALAEVGKAVERGYLHDLQDGETPCSICQTAPALVWEHRNYTDPLNVVPACFACNQREGAARLPIATVKEHLNRWWIFPYGPDPKMTMFKVRELQGYCKGIGVNEYNRRLKAAEAGTPDLGEFP